MEGLERGRIDARWPLKSGPKVDKETPAEVITKIERKIKRTGDRYSEEELTREEYRDEVTRLRRQREAYVAHAADEPDPKDLSTLSTTWRTGHPAQRWVLNALFEKIHVKQNRGVAGYTARLDRALRVRMLISTTFESVYDWPEPSEGPGAANPNRLGCGGAGI
jgi:inorganic triphosphatase YgiF